MRIAYVCADSGIPVLGNKGASVHVRELTDALVDLGHQVLVVGAAGVARGADGQPQPMRADFTLVAPRAENETTIDQLSRSVLRLGVSRDPKNLRSELRHLLSDPEFVAGALPDLGAFGPDLLIARHSIFSVAGAELARELDCRHILEVNAPLTEERRQHWGLTLADAAECAERSAFAAADAVVAVSEAVRTYVVRLGANEERVAVIPNGVDVERFHPAIDPAPVRLLYRLEGKVVFGFVGTLKPWHGVDLLLDAFAWARSTLRGSPVWRDGVRAEAEALHLLVVGDGPQRLTLEKKVRELGLEDAVTFTGVVSHDNVPSYLAAMDVTVAPYLTADDFYFSPLKVVESMAAGRPVVAPALGQIPSLLAGNGKSCGVLYRPDDRLELGAALLELAGNVGLRRSLGSAGSQLARESHSWRSVSRAILALVESPCNSTSCDGVYSSDNRRES